MWKHSGEKLISTLNRLNSEIDSNMIENLLYINIFCLSKKWSHIIFSSDWRTVATIQCLALDSTATFTTKINGVGSTNRRFWNGSQWDIEWDSLAFDTKFAWNASIAIVDSLPCSKFVWVVIKNVLIHLKLQLWKCMCKKERKKKRMHNARVFQIVNLI